MTQIERRTLLMAGLGLALRQTDPESSRPKEGDLLVKAGDATRTPLTPDDIPSAPRRRWRGRWIRRTRRCAADRG